MFRLIHLSDIHLGPLPEPTWRELASKRITGYINWHMKRGSSMRENMSDRLMSAAGALQPDHLALTGDLINLGLDSEITRMRDWLAGCGPPDRISVIPGNHDAYVPGSLKKAVTAWEPYLTGDDGRSFPYLRQRGNVALIGINSGAATPPFMATGFFRDDQAMRTARLLQETQAKGLFRIVMIHHPPVHRKGQWHKRLVGASHFIAMIAKHGAELVLHGHTHIRSRQWLAGPSTCVPVIGVPAAGHGHHDHKHDGNGGSVKPAGRFNLFDISGRAGAWSCKMEEHGTRQQDAAVECLESHMLWENGNAPLADVTVP